MTHGLLPFITASSQSLSKSCDRGAQCNMALPSRIFPMNRNCPLPFETPHLSDETITPLNESLVGDIVAKEPSWSWPSGISRLTKTLET